MEECYFQYNLKPATLLKVILLHGCFSRFLNCTNGTKSRQASHTCNKKLVKPVQQQTFDGTLYMQFSGFECLNYFTLLLKISSNLEQVKPNHKKKCMKDIGGNGHKKRKLKSVKFSFWSYMDVVSYLKIRILKFLFIHQRLRYLYA